ncbi:MAG: nucleotide sugar dehydrogenase [Planctomycetota bacterium]|jgi:UDP-N-acetyl-D-glucosamine dehydrogenase
MTRATDPPALTELLDRIDERRAVVAVLGLGHIGLSIAAAMVEAGFPVLGHDQDAERSARLARGETPLRHLGPDLVERLRATGRFEVLPEPGRLSEADAVLLCLPTPLDEHNEPDLGPVRAGVETIAGLLRPGCLVVLESTTYPGTTREVVLPPLQAAGHTCGVDLFVAYAPERVDPGRALPGTRAIPRLVGGLDEPSRRATSRLYGAAVDRVVEVSSAEVAEAAKLHENIYRAVNIAMVNEMKVLLTDMGLDVREVIAAASTKPFGFEPFEPGPGWGGHCIPIDPFYLAWRARAVGRDARFIALAGEVNRAMPDWVIDRTERALLARGTPLSGARVLVLGLAYKADIDDARESPSLQLLAGLAARGAQLAYHDPHVPCVPAARPDGVPDLSSVPLDEAALAAPDVVLVATAHSAIDWKLVARHARLVVDTRGILRGHPGDHIVPA